MWCVVDDNDVVISTTAYIINFLLLGLATTSATTS